MADYELQSIYGFNVPVFWMHSLWVVVDTNPSYPSCFQTDQYGENLRVTRYSKMSRNAHFCDNFSTTQPITFNKVT
jgi:hypothetical protein